MSLHSDRSKAKDMNFMTERALEDAKRYLDYVLSDYRDGKSNSEWLPSKCDLYSSKIANVIEKSLTYLCVDFSLKLHRNVHTDYCIMEVSFNENI